MKFPSQIQNCNVFQIISFIIAKDNNYLSFLNIIIVLNVPESPITLTNNNDFPIWDVAISVLSVHSGS